MSNEATLTRAVVAEKIAKDLGLTQQKSSEIFETILNELTSVLAQGESVKISSFGTFTANDKRPRMGRNPKTGVAAVITARRVLSFKASHILKDQINNRRPIVASGEKKTSRRSSNRMSANMAPSPLA